MNSKCLKIGKPEVVTEGDKCALRAVIDDDGVKKTLEYKVDAKYGKYLTWERSDALVVALLYYAMVFQKDIEWETPCNERLIFQLRTYLIPTYDREMEFMHSIELSGPTTTEQLPRGNGVATGLSNGVDSSYTVYKYLNCEYPEYRLTHLLFTDNPAVHHSQQFYDDYVNTYLRTLSKCAEELGLEFVFVEFHPDVDFSVGVVKNKKFKESFNDGEFFTLKLCSMAIALQKLLHVYYFSSGYALSDFSIQHGDMCHHDVFTLPLISTDNLMFLSSGMETSRLGKVESIADWTYVQKHLHVCNEMHDANCGYCNKCVRGMTELYANGKLDLFKDVFPVDDFKKNLSKRLGYMMGRANYGFFMEKEALAKIRKTGQRIPAGAYVYSVYYTVKEFLHQRLRYNKWARWVYQKLHLEKILHPAWKYNMSSDLNDLIVGKK